LTSYLILLMSLNPESGATATLLWHRQHAMNRYKFLEVLPV
jgi:hypothetical protein